MIQFEMPRQQRYQLVADDESDMPEWAEEYTICNLRSGPDPGPYMFYGGEWVMLSSYAVRDGTLKIYHDVKAGDQPWDGDASEIKEVVIADTVRSIGAGAFSSLESLEHVVIPAGVEVEDGAFSQTFKDPFDADIAMADVAGYEYVAYEGVMYQADPSIFTTSEISTGVMITGLASGYENTLVMAIPVNIAGKPVTEIDTRAFEDNIVVKIVLAHQVLDYVHAYAFEDCTALEVFNVDALKLGSYTFHNCTALASTTLKSTTIIPGYAFQGCTSLVDIDLSEVVETKSYTFNNCGSLLEVDLSSIEIIGGVSFTGADSITKVTFGKNLNTVSNSAFGSWTFYAANGTTVLNKTVAANLAGKTFKGSASRLVEDAGPQPGMEGRYMYAITTDSAGMNILSVQAAHDGRPLDTIVTASTRRQGAESIPKEWDFVDGVGPFKCWYGAFNIQDYVAGTESEEPVCTGAGMLAYRLDPYDLGTTMQGTELQGTYNVFLVVPTVYWKAVGNILYLSDDSSYAGITGMTAYAHTATLPDTTQSVFPYIGIGVYEAVSLNGKLTSAGGQRPLTTVNYDGFRDRIAALASASGCGFQMWNFYQWTLFKVMCYAVMGTKNSQWMLGAGPVSGTDKSLTGIGDDAGPYADSTSNYCKLFIENPWGSVWELIGDAMSDEYVLHAGQSLGGAAIGGQTSVGATFPESGGWVGSTSNASASWDVPTTLTASDNHGDPAACGDRFTSASGQKCIAAGGVYNHGEVAGLNLASIFFAASTSNNLLGTRTSAFFDGTAMGTPEVTTKAAPAPTRSEEEDLPDLERDEPVEEPVEEPEEEPVDEPVAEESDEGAMDIEGL